MKRHPYTCKDHPKAKVVYSYDEDYPTKNGKPIIRNQRYECAVCGKRLAPTQKEALCLAG